MLKAIIIDDEQHCIDRIESLLQKHAATIYLAATFQSVEEALQGIAILNPDLLFLDVQIQDKTGFDLLKAIPEPTFNVIFTTAYDKYAVQAFRFSAVDYLLKPIAPADLSIALGKVQNKIFAGEMRQKLDSLIANMNRSNTRKKITVPTSSELLFLEVADIIRCQSDINYTTIFLKDKQKIVVAKTLKEFEEMLAEYHFCRIHNSHLINLACIKSYNKGKGGSVLLTDGTELEVSTRRKEDFLLKLAQL